MADSTFAEHVATTNSRLASLRANLIDATTFPEACSELTKWCQDQRAFTAHFEDNLMLALEAAMDYGTRENYDYMLTHALVGACFTHRKHLSKISATRIGRWYEQMRRLKKNGGKRKRAPPKPKEPPVTCSSSIQPPIPSNGSLPGLTSPCSLPPPLSAPGGLVISSNGIGGGGQQQPTENNNFMFSPTGNSDGFLLPHLFELSDEMADSTFAEHVATTNSRLASLRANLIDATTFPEACSELTKWCQDQRAFTAHFEDNLMLALEAAMDYGTRENYDYMLTHALVGACFTHRKHLSKISATRIGRWYEQMRRLKKNGGKRKRAPPKPKEPPVTCSSSIQPPIPSNGSLPGLTSPCSLPPPLSAPGGLVISSNGIGGGGQQQPTENNNFMFSPTGNSDGLVSFFD